MTAPDLASKTVRFRASGGGYGFGLTPGQFIGLSAIELAESIARENRRQAYLKQQLEVQQQLGKDQAQIDALQRQLAEVLLPMAPFCAIVEWTSGLALMCHTPGLMHLPTRRGCIAAQYVGFAWRLPLHH